MTTTTIADIDALAARYGLAPQDLAALLTETDQARGMLGPEDLAKGLSLVVASYVRALQSAAERFEDPTERRIADRVVSMATEMLAGQLQAAAAPTSPN